KQFNSIIHADVDPITGARRDDVLMAREDAEKLGLREGATITLRNNLGQFQGRVKIDRIKPGSLQAHWPEINVLVPAGRLDPSGGADRLICQQKRNGRDGAFAFSLVPHAEVPETLNRIQRHSTR